MIALMALVALFQIELPGTQPNDLRVRLSPASSCHNCHRGFAESAGDTWAGSMMANAGRDPIYLAALTIANQDLEGSGEFCIRCHTPRGWLSGRSEATDGSMLDPVDLSSGVDCDFCHRLHPGDQGAYIGNGQYQVIDEAVTFGRIGQTAAQHGTRQSDYLGSSELCGLCHDVTNPETGFPIERTYTEWLASDFSRPPAEGGEGCVDCHMKGTAGQIAIGDMPQRTIHQHDLAGGNTWMPTVLAELYPEEREAFLHAAERAREMLQSAATLRIDTPASTPYGGLFEFTVRVTNESGHKLPTGYPEGRRCWLELEVFDADGAPLLHSGAYDEAVADRIDDPQLRTYETRLGQQGDPDETFHFVLQDTRVLDDRIPPRGFRPDPDTAPVGRTYPVQPDGSLAHFDDAPYVVMIPAGTPGPLSVRARLRYQTTSRAYVEFLRDRNVTDDRGQTLYDLWQQHGMSPPETIAEALVNVALHAPPPPDMGASGDARVPDAGAGADAGVGADGGDLDTGCRAAPGGSGPAGWPHALLGVLALLAARRTRRS